MVGVGLVEWRCRGYRYRVPTMYPALRWTLCMLPWAHLAALAGRRLEETGPQKSLCNKGVAGGGGLRFLWNQSCFSIQYPLASNSFQYGSHCCFSTRVQFLNRAQADGGFPLRGALTCCYSVLVAAAQGWEWTVHVQGLQRVFVSFFITISDCRRKCSRHKSKG